MEYRAIALHDEALELKPDGGRHDSSLCPICVEWALSADGTPTGYAHLPEDMKSKPFGEVAYADPGLREDGVHRFPIESASHAKKAQELLSREDVSSKYDAEKLSIVVAAVEEALEQFEPNLPKKTTDLAEGGKANTMDTIAQETHEALLEKAVQNATEKMSDEIARLTESVGGLETEKADLEAKVTELSEENERLNGELDTSQVKLKNAEDEVASLKEEIVTRDEAAEKGKVAEERAAQIKNLGLFPEDYITEKASRWADLSEEEWGERVEEWKQAKSSESAAPPTETASAMTGSSESEDTDKPTARKRVLGLA